MHTCVELTNQQSMLTTTQGSKNLQIFMMLDGEVLKDDNGNSLCMKNINLHTDYKYINLLTYFSCFSGSLFYKTLKNVAVLEFVETLDKM